MEDRISKYRMHFSIDELIMLYEATVNFQSTDLSSIDQTKLIKLKKKVKLAYLKASEGITKPAFVAKQQSTNIYEQLEIPKDTPKEDIRRQAYEASLRASEEGYGISEEITNLATLYRYENDMMTPEEEREYEKALAIKYAN